jgi:hypothetical protein
MSIEVLKAAQKAIDADEHMLALDGRLDRIERRLQLTDAE